MRVCATHEGCGGLLAHEPESRIGSPSLEEGRQVNDDQIADPIRRNIYDSNQPGRPQDLSNSLQDPSETHASHNETSTAVGDTSIQAEDLTRELNEMGVRASFTKIGNASFDQGRHDGVHLLGSPDASLSQSLARGSHVHGERSGVGDRRTTDENRLACNEAISQRHLWRRRDSHRRSHCHGAASSHAKTLPKKAYNPLHRRSSQGQIRSQASIGAV